MDIGYIPKKIKNKKGVSVIEKADLIEISMSKKEFSKYIKENPNEKVNMIYREYHDWIQSYIG